MSQSNYKPAVDYYSTYPYYYGYQPYYGVDARQAPTYGTQPGYPQPTPAAPAAPGAPGAPAAPAAAPEIPGMLPLEQSYVENILRLNKGKLATVYCTFENNPEWNAKIFKGIIEAAGRDHLILSDPQTGMRYLILMVYLNYVTFEEEIEYEYPFGSAPGMASYSPR
ncbi:spore coat protein GerQ [Bacillus sp. 03113]|uniref:spore coat protein GerQ n=1 Tax=Bacillus sp. 03113 TaxID=2578211 RepID=UPI0011448C6A|nr:spore coat protein GerQ [Bacillus sp. 03113]